MMDAFDICGVTLKQLDELDAVHYARRNNDLLENVKSMASSPDLAQDSNASDFDNSDDLASLLDDDDDVFAKKVFGKPATKTKKPNDSKNVDSTRQSFPSPSKEIISKASSDKPNYDEFGDDVLDEFLQSNNKRKTSGVKITSPQKPNSKENSFQDEDDDLLDDLSLNQFSPVKEKKVKPESKTSDILDELNNKNSSSKTSKERRGSYFDDFLQKLSPKHGSSLPTSPDIADENLKNNYESDEDILGSYMPSSAKKNDIIPQGVPKSPKKRGSLSKQVSFKGISDDFHETDIPKAKTAGSPDKSKNTKNIIGMLETGKTENPTHPKRSEKANLNKDEDMDWLSYFSPKKSSKADETETKTKDQKKVDLSAEVEPKPSIKRQSSADWLGLSDSKILKEGVGNDNEPFGNVKQDSINKTNLKPAKSKTVSAPIIRPQRQSTKREDSELQNNDSIKKINESFSVDLSAILKNTDTDSSDTKNKSSSIILNDSINNIDSVLKSRRGPKINSNTEIINRNTTLDNFVSPKNVHENIVVGDSFNQPAKNLAENHEHFTALQSMQMMLDESIKERNKLLKEQEATKIALEEKIKVSEEFHKSEKKMLEDSFKILESSLKQEFQIKIKSLEERLNIVTEEKEKLVKNFEEKIQNLIKDHQTEIQRLKELHSQSINILKQDHEDAISRLKKLKEQEIEAVVSTQVHSKSLQCISDQLEARANELASLENKIEERNQSYLREKHLFLDIKEKELKALQNRLMKQLDDTEEERTRLQQLVLRLESRLQKMTMEGEEDHWETKQMKAKLTVQQKYLEEEHKLNLYQIEKEKEKLKMAQDSLLHEQKTVLLQLAQERQQLTQEKIDLQALAKATKEEETKLNVRKLKEESSIEAEKQFLIEEKNRLHFEKEKIKQEFYQLEKERDLLVKEKQQFKRDREILHDQELNLRRKSSEIEEAAATAAQTEEKAQRDLAEALSIKKEQQHRMQQYSQQMQALMDKERGILSEREKLVAEKVELEKNKSSVLCTKCKLSLENPFQVSPAPGFNMPVVVPLPSANRLSNQIHQSFMDPNLVIWHVAAQKDQEFLQEELAFLKSLKETNIRKNSK